MVAQDKANSV